jgi:hypothetical protein
MQTRRTSSLTSQVDREAAAITLLDRWPWTEGGCLIGGYAVAAYSKPRFSQDLDLVLPASRRHSSIVWLEAEGFRLRPSRRVPPAFTNAATLLQGDFSIDLMFGSVRDRESGAIIREGWISAGSRQARLDLLTGTTTEKISVARPAALWALKLVSARDQDLSDLFAISGEPFEASEVREELQRAMTPSLRAKLARIPSRLSTGKVYSDALAARAMGKRNAPQNVRAWARFSELVEAALPK